MKLEYAAVFTELGIEEGPKVEILAPPGESFGWPITLSLQSQSTHSLISIHLRSETQLIQFVNSVKSSYNNYRKEKGYDR